MRELFLDKELQLVILKMPLVFPSCTSLPPSYVNRECVPLILTNICTGCLQKNGAVSKVNKKLISRLTRAQLTPSAAATVQVSHALPEIRFSCLMRGRGASFQDGFAAGKGFLCAPF